MKKIFSALFITCFTLAITAQSERSIRYDEYLLSVGMNTVNSLGSKNPFERPGDWAFRTPIAASFEAKWFDLFSIEVGASLNGLDSNKSVDAGSPADGSTLTYFSADTALKYYFGEYIFPNTEWIDFYGSAGLGLFVFDDTNISVNVGGGALFWLNRYRTFGIKAQGLAKFALDHSDSGSAYQNNHFQYHLMLVFKI